MLSFPSTIPARTYTFLSTVILIGFLRWSFLYGFLKASLQEGYSSQTILMPLPGVTIEVEKECSGINSSVALLLTALLLAHQTLSATSRRILLVLLTLPISIIKNAVRIVTLTLLALDVDRSFLTGHLHHDSGFVFSSLRSA